MYKAIFDMTLRAKVSNWRCAGAFLIGIALMTLIVIVAVKTSHTDEIEYHLKEVWNLYLDPLIYLLSAYILISDGAASKRFVGDVETMTLVVTRPIRRFDYVMAKWLAGSVGSAAVILTSAVVAQIALFACGVNLVLLDLTTVGAIILNSLGFSAFVVFLHCLPAGLAVAAYLGLYFSHTVYEFLSQVSGQTGPTWFRFIHQCFRALHDWFGDLSWTALDLRLITNSVRYDYVSVIVYLSNIFLFLWLAVWILTKREFFYGKD